MNERTKKMIDNKIWAYLEEADTERLEQMREAIQKILRERKPNMADAIKKFLEMTY